MNIVYFNNAKLEAETLDGAIVNIRNLNSPDPRNHSDRIMFRGGRLAIVFGVEDASASPSIDFDGPGDISRNSIEGKE
ncbi:MAG: hypothetical protein E5W65_10900 [Mesorhizobium sp.]|uniref:hypothetical protein n=1 Tax=Mesorhizobium sp. TaxID=1871066 RepID=UPI0011F745C6|nr:hypothetical protein [Mesorhizobium sp.]TIT36016.1 MAG: hypothetical protein E5W65_10900 [Mesorhizobium sp.]